MSLSEADVDDAYDHVTGLRSVRVDRSEFADRLRRCYQVLTEIASDGGTITYDELTDRLDLLRSEEVRPLLDAIAYVEHEHGRPPLPVIVVKKSNRSPGVGFFDTVDRLGLRDGYRARTDQELLRMMATNVYAEWQSAEA